MPFLSDRFAYRFEADLAAEYLAEQEIEARVSASDAGGAVPALQPTIGVRLEVAAEDLDRAGELIREWRSSGDSAVAPLSRDERLQSWIGGALLLLLLVGSILYLMNSPSTNESPEIPIQAQAPY